MSITYNIDTAHSHAQFKVRHMMIANVKGEFTTVTGTVNYDEANPSNSTIEAAIDVATISTRDAQRDGHLKSADFFDVEKYPQITFKSTGVKTADGETHVQGDLTIHGVTKSVNLTVESFTPEAKDPWGYMRRGAEARTKISRKDFGMEFNVALEAGGFLVGDDVEITVDVELVRQA
jgi:polyisoprenoid-binding protein YceI